MDACKREDVIDVDTLVHATERLKTLDERDEYKCAITGEYMSDPVHAADGFAYEHESIVAWFRHGDNETKDRVKSPRTNLPMTKHLFRVFDFYTKYKAWCEETGRPLPVRTTTFGMISDVPTPAPARRVRSPSPPRAPAPAPIQEQAPAPEQNNSRFQVVATDIPFQFMLTTQMPYVLHKMEHRRRLGDRTLEGQLSALLKDELLSLFPQDMGLIRKLRSKTNTWLIEFLEKSIHAYHANGLTSMDAERLSLGKYRFRFRGVPETDTPAYSFRLRLPMDFAIKLVGISGLPGWRMEPTDVVEFPDLKALYNKMDLESLYYIAHWNDIVVPRGLSKRACVSWMVDQTMASLVELE
jgi:hypothetical protein